MNDNFVTSEIGIDLKKNLVPQGKHSNNQYMNLRNGGHWLKSDKFTTVSTA